MAHKPKTKSEPDIFEQVLGSRDRAQQAVALEHLAMAAVSPVYGMLILMDSRPGKDVRIVPLGDQVPLAMLRALATQTAEIITQQELKAAANVKAADPNLSHGDDHANQPGLPSPIPNPGPAAPRARRR